jgi:hypothetical protein
MTLEEAEQMLQVSRNSDSESIIRAKNKQLDKAGDDAQKRFMVRRPAQSLQVHHGS